MLVVTFILAALVLLMMVQLPYMYDAPSVPETFKITNIRHDQKGVRNFDSYMVITNMGTTGYKNKNLYAKTYRNGIELDCRITTLNGEDFIPTHHFMIQNLGGYGSRGTTWDPGEQIFIDFTDRTFHPGDVVTFEVYDAVSDQIISRHTYKA